MGFLAHATRSPRLHAALSPTDDYWYREIGGLATHAGVVVSHEVALQVGAVYACCKVISETLAMLPLLVYEQRPDGSRARATQEQTYRLLHRQPNSWQTPFDFKEVLTGWAALHGNGYAIKRFNAAGTEVDALVPVHPRLVRPELVDNDQLRYWIRDKNGTEKAFVQGEILHVRGLSLDGIAGADMSKQARQAIALAAAMEAFGARYFANDTTVGITLQHPGKLSKEAHQRLTDSLAAQGGWQNAFKAKILEEGMKIERALANAKDAQLIEGRAGQVIEICRFFRMPPHKIQHLLQATFSNIEHQGIEFATDTMQPWAVRWEQAVTRDLILDDETYYAEFLMAALLRGDATARAAYYTARFNMGTLSRNEIRALENENPVDGGDVFYLNAATVPIGDDGRPVPQATRRPDGGQATGPRETLAAAIEPLLVDAAARIARAETRELSKRADKAKANQARFAAWADEFYAAHLGYVVKTLQPLATAAATMGVQSIDVSAVAHAVVASSKAAVVGPLFCSAPQQVLDALPAAILEHLTAAFIPGRPSDAAAA